MQEAWFAGACQDQRAGRPKEINQCNKPRQASFLKNLLVVGLGAQGLGPGLQGLGSRAPGLGAHPY